MLNLLYGGTIEYPLVVGNWKMNLDLFEATVLAGRISLSLEKIAHVDVAICPPAVFLYPIFEHLKSKPKTLVLGLQDVMWESNGSYTGAVSVDMVRGICRYAIVGHSERRRVFGETDEMVAKKAAFLTKKNITPIVCVGEAEKFHLEDHFQSEVLRMKKQGGILSQIEKALSEISKQSLGKVVIAYEPIWAIGTGNSATGAYAAAICYLIRDFISKKYCENIAQSIRILYGGSVSSRDVREFMLQPSINGLLVGSASLKASEFIDICKISSEVKSGRTI